MRSFVKKCAPLLGRNLQRTKMLGCQHDVLLSGTVQQRVRRHYCRLISYLKCLILILLLIFTAKQPTHKAVASTSTAGTSTRLPQASGSATGTSKEPPQDFTYLPDGSLHLRNGIVLTKVQASRIISHKKSSLVVKETAQAIWTQSGLAMRSVKGGVAPRKRGTAETAKPRLTPEKVEVVAATLEHWGKVNKNDITAAMKNLTNILCEKIQDCVKSERRQQLTQQALL
ncbi:BEN domain-containing protein 5-like isoform X2 [Amblyomma americanum]